MKSYLCLIGFIFFFLSIDAQPPESTATPADNGMKFNHSLIINQEIYLPGEEINFTLLRKHRVNEPIELRCALTDL